MITRIVRLEFRPEEVENFLTLFDMTKERIRHFPGVRRLELHRDANQQNVFYTFSIWDSEAALESYRVSELFQQVWNQTKALFADKAQAFSLLLLQEVQ